jgi:hypothetical protein
MRTEKKQQVSPGEVRATTDPSAAPGMTKGIGALSTKRSYDGSELRIVHPVTNVLWKCRALLCHPERTRISCHAAPDTAACAPFSKERRMEFANATKFYRKSGVAEGSAVPRTSPGET